MYSTNAFYLYQNKEVLRVTSQDTRRLIKPFPGSTLKLERNTEAPL